VRGNQRGVAWCVGTSDFMDTALRDDDDYDYDDDGCRSVRPIMKQTSGVPM